MNKKIVTIGGGHGQSSLLAGMRDLKNIELSAVVSMFDSGGSTGKLRQEFDLLPPGDILKCILALSPDRGKIEKLIKHRFQQNGKLKGHSLGNLLVLVLNQFSSDFPKALGALSEAFEIKAKVFPVTIVPSDIEATLEDGKKVFGETAIDVPAGKRAAIKDLKVVAKKGKVKAYPPAVQAIKKADYLILTYGDFYTSLIPNLVVPEIKNACRNFKGKIIYFVNSYVKKGETDNYTGKDFVVKLEKYLGRKVDYVVLNDTKKRFKNSNLATPLIQGSSWEGRAIIKGDYCDHKSDFLYYDGEKTAKIVNKIINL